mmetsp:Transcript_116666/g.371145  ORF Transcript_116666/g.371145 Transcript_116666/m.371145 type:complete len:1217 (-) Transcript_116666:107-3757(-)
MLDIQGWVGDSYAFKSCFTSSDSSTWWRASREDPTSGRTGHFAIRIDHEIAPHSLASDRFRPCHRDLCLLADCQRLPCQENILRIFAHFYDDPARLGLSSRIDAHLAASPHQHDIKPCGSCLFVVLETFSSSLRSLAEDRRCTLGDPSLFSDAELLVVIEQVSKALEHLKSHSIAHRALRPEGIVVTGRLEHATPGVVKLRDFGHHWDADKPEVIQGQACKSSLGDCPDMLFCSPDSLHTLLQGGRVDFFANDIWALGRTIYAVACHLDQCPFPGSESTLDLFDATNYRRMPKSYGAPLQRLVKRMLEPKLNLRPRSFEVRACAHDARRESGALEPLMASTRLVEPFEVMQSPFFSPDLVLCSADARANQIAPLVVLLSTGSDDQQVLAAWSLCKVACESAENSVAVADAGCIPHVVALLSSGCKAVREAAVDLIAALASGDDLQQLAVSEKGGLRPLASLLSSSDLDEAANALQVFRVLSSNECLREEIVQAGTVPTLVRLLTAGNTTQQDISCTVALEVLSRLASSSTACRQMSDVGAILVLIELFGSSGCGGRGQALAALLLERLACSSPDARAAVVAQGGARGLVALLAGPETSLHAQAAAALESLVGHDAPHSAAIVEAGGVACLVAALSHGDRATQASAARALHRLAVCPHSKWSLGEWPGTSALVSVLDLGGTAAKEHAAGTLAQLAADAGQRTQMVEAGAILLLVKLLKAGGASELAGHAAATLGGLALDAEREQSLVESGAVACLARLLTIGHGSVRQSAAEALANLARHGAETRLEIARVGSIHPVVMMLTTGNTTERVCAARALRNLAFEEQCRFAIVQAGGITPLVSCVASEGDEAQEPATGAVRNLTMGVHCEDTLRVAVVEAGGIPALVGALTSAVGAVREQAVAALRNLAFDPTSKAAIAASGIDELVRLLSDSNAVTRANAAGTLSNLTCSSLPACVVADAGPIPSLVTLLASGSEAGRERAVATLGNLSLRNSAQQVAIIDAGGVPLLISCLSASNPTDCERAAAVLRNFAADNPASRMAISAAGGIPRLVGLLREGNSTAQEHAAAALWSMAYESEHRAAIAEAGGIAGLVALIAAGSPSGQENAAAALWNLTCGNSREEIAIVAIGGITSLVWLLSAGNGVARMNAAGALANLADGSTQAKAAILEAGGINALRTLLLSTESGAVPGDTAATHERSAWALVVARECAGKALELLDVV